MARLTDKEMCKHFGHLEEHQYKHFNRSLGMFIESKEHFKKVLEQGNYLPFDKAEQERKTHHQPYNGVSTKTMKFLHQVKDIADSKGNIEVSDRFVKGLKEHGVKVDCMYDRLPNHYKPIGGFDNG